MGKVKEHLLPFSSHISPNFIATVQTTPKRWEERSLGSGEGKEGHSLRSGSQQHAGGRHTSGHRAPKVSLGAMHKHRETRTGHENLSLISPIKKSKLIQL